MAGAVIHLHAVAAPPRAQTHLDGCRFWAAATEPHETLADVLAHLAAQIIAAGAPGSALAAVWMRGGPMHPPVPLAALAGNGGDSGP